MLPFIKERPPIVIFLLCIIISTLTFLYFSFYIKNTDLIPDSDTAYDWNHLLKYLKQLDICISNQNGRVDESNNYFTGIVTVETLVNIDLLKFQNYTEARGFLSLDGWHTTCPKNTPKPNSLEIYFELPNKVENDTNGNVCISIKGPAEYLPKFSEQICAVKESKTKDKVGYITSTVRAKYTDNFCQDGISTTIDFLQTKHTMINFLGNGERSLIYIHLLWTSFILIFVILAIIIYGVFQSDTKLDKYIDKCKNLIHYR
ncbi:hypothetical protein JTB14_037628 [Gonioctena quinquepunctata]|nr:hypothetical protein JTB14_037628 [Gonioctena quinquepunctata]